MFHLRPNFNLCSVSDVLFPLPAQVLICRNYKGDVDMAEIDHFMSLLMQQEEEGLLSPVMSHGTVHFMWIKHSNLYRILVLSFTSVIYSTFHSDVLCLKG